MSLMPSGLRSLGVPAALIAVAVVWGAAFVVVDEAIAIYPMYGFLGWRFAVAAAAFLVLFPRTLRRIDAENLRMGGIAGVFLTLGYIFQTWGLDGARATTPARAAFITGLYVVMTPLLQSLILRTLPRKSTIAGALTALAGLWVLSGAGLSEGLGFGDLLVVACALAYAIHMIVLGSTDARHDTAALTFVQLVVAAVACGGISAVVERPGVPTDGSVWLAIVTTGVFASAVAFGVQTWAQRRIPPARVALILVTETAFGGLFGWWAAGAWPIREIAGAGLMMGGMVTSEAMAAFGDRVGYEPGIEGMPVPMLEEEQGSAGSVAPTMGTAEERRS